MRHEIDELLNRLFLVEFIAFCSGRLLCCWKQVDSLYSTKLPVVRIRE